MVNRVVTLDDIAARFGEISVRIADITPVTRIGGIMGLGEVKDRFMRQIDPDGIPWKPLAYPRPEGGNIVLRNHGILAGSYSSESNSNSWTVGTNLRHARTHQYGAEIVPTKRKWLTIPLTREAIYSGGATRMHGLHFRMRAGQMETAGLYDAAGVKHWHLTKRSVIPARAMVGVSDALLDSWIEILVTYITTGEL